jgi:hypothetical protein
VGRQYHRYIALRLILRIKMGKKRRDEYIQQKGINMFDFLPERAFSINGFKAILVSDRRTISKSIE